MMTMTEKLAAAIAWLDTRWVLHPANHVQRGDYSTQNNRHVDVAATFARVRERLTGESK